MDIMSYLLGQNSAIKKGMKVIVVDELPTTGEVNVLYLVPKEDTGENDIFEEWLYVEDEWEKIGTTDIDLSNYYTKGEVTDITGLLANLQTTDKTNLVSAINELFANGSPIKEVDIGTVSLTMDSFNSNTVIANLYGTGNYGMYILNGIISGGSNVKGPVGVLINKDKTNYTYQQLFIFGTNDALQYSLRTVDSNGYRTSFVGNEIIFPPFGWAGKTSLSSTNKELIRNKDLISLYGTKGINSLTTTNKDSLVDAINEVNPKGLTGYDATKTQTLKNINGTLTWVDD